MFWFIPVDSFHFLPSGEAGQKTRHFFSQYKSSELFSSALVHPGKFDFSDSAGGNNNANDTYKEREKCYAIVTAKKGSSVRSSSLLPAFMGSERTKERFLSLLLPYVQRCASVQESTFFPSVFLKLSWEELLHRHS